MPDTVTIEAHDRSYDIADPGGRIGSKLEHGEVYERRLLDDIYDLGLTGTAFDLGAHVGNHALWLAAICGFSVHAWEPHKATATKLRANVRRNPDIDVTVHGWAAGDRATRGRFSGEDGSRTIKVDRGDVPVKRIDDHVTVEDLAVVKADVEGMESHALAGAAEHLKRCRPVVYTEVHTDIDRARIAAVLDPLGYHADGEIQMGSLMVRWRA